MLEEKKVEKAMRSYLKDHGFVVKQRKRKQGVNIVAIRNGETYYVEVEGNRKPNGNPLTTSQKYTHLLRAIGQICLRMNDDPDGVFIIGLPEDEYYREKIDKLRFSLRKLNVKLYFVDSSGKIAEE